MRVLGLPEALRKFGLTVETVPGWQTRGSDAFNPGGSIGHHTAGSSRGTRPSLGICTYGRTDLPGPLCNTFTDRNGVAIVVASGRANHAGRGLFRGLTGNSAFLGHEAEDEGDGIWTPAQRWAFPRVHAAHLWLLGRDSSWYVSHRAYATPAGRKPDPAGLEDDDMRHQIHALLTHTKEDDMPALTDGQAYQLDWLFNEFSRKYDHPLRHADANGQVFQETPVAQILWARGESFLAKEAARQAVAEIGALRAAVAANAGGNLTPEQVMAAAKDGAAAALDEKIDSARVEIAPKE